MNLTRIDKHWSNYMLTLCGDVSIRVNDFLFYGLNVKSYLLVLSLNINRY